MSHQSEGQFKSKFIKLLDLYFFGPDPSALVPSRVVDEGNQQVRRFANDYALDETETKNLNRIMGLLAKHGGFYDLPSNSSFDEMRFLVAQMKKSLQVLQNDQNQVYSQNEFMDVKNKFLQASKKATEDALAKNHQRRQRKGQICRKFYKGKSDGLVQTIMDRLSFDAAQILSEYIKSMHPPTVHILWLFRKINWRQITEENERLTRLEFEGNQLLQSIQCQLIEQDNRMQRVNTVAEADASLNPVQQINLAVQPPEIGGYELIDEMDPDPGESSSENHQYDKAAPYEHQPADEDEMNQLDSNKLIFNISVYPNYRPNNEVQFGADTFLFLPKC